MYVKRRRVERIRRNGNRSETVMCDYYYYDDDGVVIEKRIVEWGPDGGGGAGLCPHRSW